MINLGDLEKYFYRLLEKDEQEQQRYLEELATQNPDLAARVKALLDTSLKADDLFEKPLLPDIMHPLRQIWEYIDRECDRPPLQVGGYQIEKVLGKGGMGIVYKAIRQDVYQEVALKILRAERRVPIFWERFEVEKQALALMKHENIAHFYDAGTTEAEEPYLVMEFVDGQPIHQYCQENGLDLASRILLFQQVCDGIIYAHSKGVIHGDLKPANILVISRSEGPSSKIIDFGIAKGYSLAALGFLEKEPDLILGSPPYMCPEQARTQSVLDTYSDVYALGSILFELIAGFPPLQLPGTRDPEKILKAIQTMPRLSLDTTLDDQRAKTLSRKPKNLKVRIRQELKHVVAKAIALDPADRYRTAGELRDDLTRFSCHEPVSAVPDSKFYRFKKWQKRHRLTALASLVSGLGILIALAAALFALHRSNLARRNLEKVKSTHELYNSILETPHPYRMGRDIRFLDVVQYWERQLDNVASDDEEQQANLHMTLGNTLFGLGLYKEAEPHFVTAGQLRHKTLGLFDHDTLLTEDRLAFLDYHLSRFESSLTRFRILRQHTQPPDIFHLRALRGLLMVHIQQSESEEVSQLVTSIEALLPGYEGSDQEVQDVMAVLANYHERQGNFGEAQSLLESVLSGQTERLGAEHPRTLLTLDSLANIYLRRELLEKALELYTLAADSREKTLGHLHPYTLRSRSGLSLTHWRLGHNETGLAIAEETYQRANLALGPDDPLTLSILKAYGNLVGAIGQKETALEIFTELVDRHRRLKTLQTRNGLEALNNLGHYLKENGRYNKAEVIVRESIDLKLARVNNPWSQTVLYSKITLAEVLLARNKLEDVEKILLAVYGLLTTHYVEEPHIRAKFLFFLGPLFLEIGQERLAEEALVESFALYKNRPDRREAVAKMLVDIFLKAGKADKAKPYLPYINN